MDSKALCKQYGRDRLYLLEGDRARKKCTDPEPFEMVDGAMHPKGESLTCFLEAALPYVKP